MIKNPKSQTSISREAPITKFQIRVSAVRSKFWSLTLGASLGFAVWCLVLPLRVHAQGPLAPPSAPTPSMKSLDQIEARTPISSLPFTISSSGSYYLTKDLSVSTGNGLTISADKVTVDLNGFTISSTAASATGTAIFVNASNIAIHNGSVSSGVTVSGGNFSGSGFANGIEATGSAYNVRVSGVEVFGCLSDGINVGGSNSSVVESCSVRVAGLFGILASVVRDSAAISCGMDAILGDEVLNCNGSAVAGGSGIYANQVGQNCFGTSVSGYGVIGGPAAVQNCYGQSSSGTGLSGYSVQNCYAFSNSGTALNGIAITNCYASNTSTTNPTITGTTVRGCYGLNTTAGPAISATYNVTDSVGYSSGGNGIKVISAKTVSNSYATATTTAGATAIAADVVQNCSASVAGASSPVSFAINANDSVLNSVGVLTAGLGTAIIAPNISNCYGSAGSGNCAGLSGTNISYSYGVATSVPGAGINVQNGTVAFCAAQNTSGDGIFADRSTVKSCSIAASTNGIRVGNVCLIEGNTCDGNTTGIRVIGNSSTLDSNRVSCPAGGNAFVFESTGTNNFIIRNTVRENGANPFILTGANNHYGPLVNVSGVVGGDISATTNANHPWANFIY